MALTVSDHKCQHYSDSVQARVGTGNSDNGSNGTATLRLCLPVAGSSDEKRRKLPWQYREIELRPEVGKDNARSK